MLVREYLLKLLYSERGYFVSTKSPIIFGSKINFEKLAGVGEWTRIRNEMLTAAGDWLTQSECFAPYFSNVLVEFALKNRKINEPLNIIEIGAGNGTNALCFLDTLKMKHPEIYKTTKYRLCEISTALGRIQKERLGKDHGSVATVEILNFLNWNRYVNEHTIIFALEVLDNLPHDKITSKRYVETFTTREEWEEIIVEPWGAEVTRPLKDSLAIETAQLFVKKPIENNKEKLSWLTRFTESLTLGSRRKYEKNATSVFIPTGAVQLLHVLRDYFPQHTFLAADFSYLPFPNVPKTKLNMNLSGNIFNCRNAPIVSGTDKSGKRVDFPSYIGLDKTFDVFFQTDFENFQNAYEQLVCGKGKVDTCRAYIETYISEDDKKKTTTRSGYNPLIEDFTNISFFQGFRN